MDPLLRYPFSVDTWSPSSSRKRHHFLTHAHLDHTRGLSSHAPFRIYCTSLTARLVLVRLPKMVGSAFVEVAVEEPKLVEDEDGSFTVTAYDANHCPGAVMFLFEGNFGNVLHTGDCRLTLECYSRLPRRLFGGAVDCLFLDCTFGKEAVKMPLKDEAVKQVKECIWNHSEAPLVYLACDLLGQETLLSTLFSTFGVKIYVDKHSLPDFYGTLSVVAPDLVTDDPESTRFHLCEGFPKLYEKARQKFAEAHEKGRPEPVFIRPSAQWYTYGERLEGVGSGLVVLEKIYEKAPSLTRRRAKSMPSQAERDPFGIWHVCYSMHSSKEELEAFLLKLRPKQVVSTTPNCKATELGYVQSLKYSVSHERIERKETKCNPAVDMASVETKEELLARDRDKLLVLSSPARSVPLFGRAAVGLLPSPPLSFDSEQDCRSDDDDAASNCSGCTKSRHARSCKLEESIERGGILREVHCSTSQKVLQQESYHQQDLMQNNMLTNSQNATEKRVYSSEKKREATSDEDGEIMLCCRLDRSKAQESSHSTKNCGFGEATRRTYRSLKMAVPRPLPSLLQIDRQNKRFKI